MNKITISGDIGSGKSTVAGILSNELRWDLVSTGEIFRQIAKERNLTVLELHKVAEEDKSVDRNIDNYLKSLSNRSDIVIDSRLAWHFSKPSLKVYLTVDIDRAVERIFNDPRDTEKLYSSKVDIKNSIQERTRIEDNRYLKLYGINIRDEENYDLVINTEKMNNEEVVEKILHKLKGGGEYGM